MALNVFSKESGLSKKSIVIKNVIPFENNGELVFRIFNLSPKGYIVVSAEDNTIPILGYGLDSNFSFDDAPPALLFLLGEYKNEISYIKEKGLKADENIISKWATYSSPEYNSLKSYSPSTVLLETNWGQNSPFNNDCPLDPNTGYRCKVGCTAVALGQILNYWECKVFPDGTRTYTPLNFSNSLTVNFYDQDYNWDDIGSVVSATSEFLYHCGVAIRVNYTDSATSGYSSRVEYAMENNFGFETSGLKSKSSYTSSTWINMLKSDIDSERPIYYDGTDTTVTPNTAHAWVIDGYRTDNTFHCNWGWTGGSNEWFALGDLTPDIHNYNYNQHAIIGAEPILDACSGFEDIDDLICSSTSDITFSVSIPANASVT